MDLQAQINKIRKDYFTQGYSYDTAWEMAIKDVMLQLSEGFTDLLVVENTDFQKSKQQLDQIIELYNHYCLTIGAKSQRVIISPNDLYTN